MENLYIYNLNEDGMTYSIGGKEKYKYQEAIDGSFDIVLPSIYNGKPITKIQAKGFEGWNCFRTVVIPSTVTSIGERAFSVCDSLQSITIPDSVTSIGESAFSICWSLTSITIPRSVNLIGGSAFDGCTSLKSIIISNGVASIENTAFENCSALTSITIPSSVTFIGDALFYGCTSLSSINVDKENTKYDSRNDCNAIIETNTNTLVAGCKNTIIPTSVTAIAWRAFDGCTSLSSLTIPSSVTTIEGFAFWGCKSLLIFAEATEKPTGWEIEWNPNNRPVYWYSETPNYDGTHWRYVDEVPAIWKEN